MFFLIHLDQHSVESLYKNCDNFGLRAAQKCGHLVYLETCSSCYISIQTYVVAKIGFGTTENEPSKVSSTVLTPYN